MCMKECKKQKKMNIFHLAMGEGLQNKYELQGKCSLFFKLVFRYFFVTHDLSTITWCVQVLRSPKEAFAAAIQSWRECCEKCVCLQGDCVEK